jgi:PKD repeat protein
MTYIFPQDKLSLLINDSLSIFFDDTTTGAGDGYAIDFVKLLINLKEFAHTGSIYGYVTDYGSGLPIHNATVVTQGFSEFLTNEDGYYEFNEVPAGINFLQASKFGYDTASNMIDLIAGDTVQVDFVIRQVLEAEFSADPLSGVYPLTVKFTDLSTQNPTEWYWDFGDGDTSTSQHPEHVYNNAGLFTVKLTARNESESNMETKVDYIQVGTFGVSENEIIKDLKVYPNPVSSTTFLKYYLERNSGVDIEIINVQGKKIQDIMSTIQTRGEKKVQWNTEQLPAGIYYIRIQAEDQDLFKKIVKVK